MRGKDLERGRLKEGVPGLLWLMTASYVFFLLLSPPGWLPGEPVWAIRSETLQEILDESLNFFFVLPLLNRLDIQVMEAPVVHPAMEAFFNFAEAWIFMFLPLLLLDPRGDKLPRVPVWGAAMFLTNVFLMPYMAARSQQPAAAAGEKGRLAKAFGWVGLLVGSLAIYWFIAACPEFGSIADRVAYFGEQVVTSRVTLAFCVDLLLFGIFQTVLMGAAIAREHPLRWLRFLPFFGLAIWLIAPER
ncbi:MAG: hypothetical protein F6J97_01695 [Leptolyngbya sp. SIO4C1]|nr:hypothetical protein [Leptolyngbya sp. SIO4C1]